MNAVVEPTSAIPLLIVWSEDAAMALRLTLSACDVIAASGKPKPDLKEIKNRNVTIWPDADEPGRAAGAKIAKLLLSQGCTVRVIDPPDDWAPGYDAADAVADGLPLSVLIASAKQLAPVQTQAAKSKTSETERPAYLTWQDLGLAANERGPYATESNAVLILRSHPEFAGRIWLDTFSGRIMLDERPFDMDLDAVRCQVWMQHTLELPKMPFTVVQRAVLLLASANQRNPLKNFLDSLTWDNTDRLPTFLEDAFSADTEGQLEYVRAIGKNWMIAAVARIYNPGCQFKNCLIAEGAQDAGKSSAFRILGGEYFLENVYNPTRQRIDFLQTLQGKWIVEIPEFDRAGDVTALLSLQTDSYRGSYGRTPMDHPRQCVFAGTTNYGQYHSDVTGAVRLWSFRAREVNLDYLRQNRDQLWAEAVARYKRGEPWHIVPLDQAREQQEARREGDPWQSLVSRWIVERPYREPTGELTWVVRQDPVEKIFVTDILLQAVQRPAGQWSNADERRIASILRAMGWERRKIRHEGRVQWGFVPRDTGNLQETMRTTSRVVPSDDDAPY